jgi:high-affinity nickel-transport protein
MLSAAALGFALGLRHAVDPDHVIAVSTLLARHRSAWQASWVGISWGLGHAATLLAVGFALLALRIAIPERVTLSLELAVGAMLVGLGAANLVALRQGVDEAAVSPESRPLPATLARSGLVGLVHGLAGSAAVALLASTAMPTTAAALAYLAVFGLGTIAGMVACTVALGAPLSLIGGAAGLRRVATGATGAASLLFGGIVLWQVGGAVLGVAS